MPKVPDSHLMAQEAILRVSSIMSDAGALCEVVKNDYGEDIVAQTHVNGRADSFSIFIQVKSRELKLNRNGFYSINIDTDHLVRWVSHHQPVLIAIYDRKSQIVYGVFPRERFTLWELTTNNKKSFSLSFDHHDVLDKNNTIKIIWKCRLNYYSSFIGWNESSVFHNSPHADKKFLSKIRQEINLITFFFLKDVGIISNDGLSDRFLNSIRICSINFSKGNDRDLKIGHVLMLCLLGATDEVGAPGVPTNLLNHGTELLKQYFRAQHSVQYQEAQKQLNSQADDSSRR